MLTLSYLYVKTHTNINIKKTYQREERERLVVGLLVGVRGGVGWGGVNEKQMSTSVSYMMEEGGPSRWSAHKHKLSLIPTYVL